MFGLHVSLYGRWNSLEDYGNTHELSLFAAQVANILEFVDDTRKSVLHGGIELDQFDVLGFNKLVDDPATVW